MPGGLVKGLLAAGAVCAILPWCGAQAATGGCNLPTDGPGGMTILYDQMNAMRVGQGLGALSMSVPLTIAAQIYACKLAAPDVSGVGEPSRASAYVEMRRAGCRAQYMENTALAAPVDGRITFAQIERAGSLRRVFMSSRVKEVGLGIAMPVSGQGNPIWVIVSASGC